MPAPDPKEVKLREDLDRSKRALAKRNKALHAARMVVAELTKRRAKKKALVARRRKRLNDYLERRANRGRKAAVDFAVKHVGVHETPGFANSDRGGPIDRWIRDVGMAPGPWAPWCGAFVHACLKAGGVDLPDGVRYCPTILAWARNGDYGLELVSAAKARPGDLKLFDWNRDGTMDHVGLVLDGPADAIEGNTSPGNSGSQSDGGGVWRRTRYATYYVRVPYPLS